MKAIVRDRISYRNELILGVLSCVIWTLTIQTTIKYVLIIIRADNKGEGGIFSLFALLRKSKRWIYVLAIAGGSLLLADGIITPAITVVSSIEGLQMINPDINVLYIVVIILAYYFQFSSSERITSESFLARSCFAGFLPLDCLVLWKSRNRLSC